MTPNIIEKGAKRYIQGNAEPCYHLQRHLNLTGPETPKQFSSFHNFIPLYQDNPDISHWVTCPDDLVDNQSRFG